MPEPDVLNEYYKGFQLVAKFYRGRYQGRAWHVITGKNFPADGAGLNDVVANLKLAVDTDVAANLFFYQERVSQKHIEYLAKLAKPDRGRGSISRYRRDNSCYSCRCPVSNAFDLECRACGWIVCSQCAACGCGYGANPEIEALFE
ncbi:MAG TPA: hypothetical protein VGR65_04960 [Casimicrobiaceae bacterium]|nr:hypothetical protein [Casimicrobiaceae bacterium]